MNSAERLRLENEAGRMLQAGADPREVIGLLAPLEGGARTRASWLRSQAWLEFTKRSGPSDEAEQSLRNAFEATLADPGEGELATIAVLQSFAPFEEYLAMNGRFDEAQAGRERASRILGMDAFARPREHIAALAAALVREFGPGVFEQALLSTFLPRVAAATEGAVHASDLRMSRLEGALPDGRSLEMFLVGFPTSLRTGEPLWIAFVRVARGTNARLFSLEWSAEERVAKPSAWSSDPSAPRTYGQGIGAGPPRGNLGPASPYMTPFAAFIGQQMLQAPASSAPFAGAANADAALADLLRNGPPRMMHSPGPVASPPSSKWRARTFVLLAVGIVIVGLAVFVARRVLTDRAEVNARLAYRAALTRLAEQQPVPAYRAPFACSGPRVPADGVSIALRDVTKSSSVIPAPGYRITPALQGEVPFVIRGEIRAHRTVKGVVPDQELDIDMELVRFDPTAGRAIPAVLCQGTVHAHVPGETVSDLGLYSVSQQVACKGLVIGACDGSHVGGRIDP